jgi:tetratricopeptide (TPR) repeat protein
MKKTGLYLIIICIVFPVHAWAGKKQDGISEQAAWQLFMSRNESGAAEEAFRSILNETPHAPTALFGLRAVYQMRADYENAARVALEMGRLREDKSPLPFLGAYTLLLLNHEFRGFADLVEEEIAARLSGPGRKNPLTVSLYKRILRKIYLVRGEAARAEEMLARMGFLRDWLVTGPFGIYERLAFYQPFPPEKTTYAYQSRDPDRTDEPGTLPYTSRSGELNVPASVREQGVFYFSTFVNIREKGKYYFLVHANKSLRLWVDGRPVLTMDHFSTFCPTTMIRGVKLKPGWHRITFKTVAGPEYHTFSVQFLDEMGRPVIRDGEDICSRIDRCPPVRSAKVKTVDPPIALEKLIRKQWKDKSDPLPVILEAVIARSAGDFFLERQLLDRALRMAPESAYIHYLSGLNYLYRSFYTKRATSMARAKKSFTKALALDPEATDALFELAKIEYDEGDSLAAIAALDRCCEQQPANSAFYVELFDIYHLNGWLKEAREALEKALALNPQSIKALYAGENFYKKYGPKEAYHRLNEEIARYHPYSLIRANYFNELGDVDGALQAFETYRRSDPFDLNAAAGELSLLLESGRLEEAEKRLAGALLSFPRNPTMLQFKAKLLMLKGEGEQADEAMKELLSLSPENIRLRRWFTFQKKEDILRRYAAPLNGLDRKSFSPAEYPGVDSVLVMDNAVTLINENGSAIRYYYNLIAVLTEEGVERESEIRIPDAFDLLKVYTIKPDGRKLEPIDITGDVIQVPGLAPGDQIELEYYIYSPPSMIGRKGFRNDLYFVFQGPNRPFVLSEYTLIHEKDLDVQVEESNIRFEPEDYIDGAYRVRRWTVRDSLPYEPEPFAPPSYTFVPYIRETYNQSWDDVIGFFLNTLTGKFTLTEHMQVKARSLTRNARTENEAVKALYDYVQRNIKGERGGLSADEHAVSIYQEKEGSRLILLKGFLDHLGLDTTIVLTRPLLQKGSFLTTPNLYNFSYPLLRVKLEKGGDLWLDTNDSSNQFGLLHPLIQGSDGLVLKMGAAPVIVTLPHQPMENEKNRLFYHLTFDRAGNLTAEVRETFSGMEAAQLRSAMKNAAVEDLRDRMEVYLNQYFPGVRMVSFHLENETDEERPLAVCFTFRGDGYAKEKDGFLTVSKIFRPLNFGASYMNLKERTLPLWIDNQLYFDYELWIDFPPVERSPVPLEPKTVSTDFGDYEIRWQWRENRLKINKHLWLPIQIVSPEQYDDFCSFGHVVSKDDQLEFTVKLRK